MTEKLSLRLKSSICILILLLMSGLSACTISGQINPFLTEASGPRFVPEWYNELPNESNRVYSSGKAVNENPSLASSRAQQRARANYTTALTSALDDIKSDTGPGKIEKFDQNQLGQLREKLTENQSSHLILSTEKVVRDGQKYLAYVLLESSLDDLKEVSRNSYPEFTKEFDWSRLTSRYEAEYRDLIQKK